MKLRNLEKIIKKSSTVNIRAQQNLYLAQIEATNFNEIKKKSLICGPTVMLWERVGGEIFLGTKQIC